MFSRLLWKPVTEAGTFFWGCFHLRARNVNEFSGGRDWKTTADYHAARGEG